MRNFLLLAILMITACAGQPERKVDYVLVEKSKNQLHLIKDEQPIRSYQVALGQNPVGHKVQRGDLRTPEGRYNMIFKNENSKFYRSIYINYPNEHDKIMAQLRGVDPGADIVLHGLPNGYRDNGLPFQPMNWTQGCLAVRNHEMDEIMSLVEVNTPIEIRP